MIDPTAGVGRIGGLQLGEEGGAIGGHEVDHEPRRLALARIEHEGFVDQERSAHVDDDARFAGREQAEAVAGDEPPLLGAEARRHLEIHLGQIDDDPVRIGEREDVDADLLRQIGDEAGAGAVAGKPRVLGDGFMGARGGVPRRCHAAGESKGNEQGTGWGRPQ